MSDDKVIWSYARDEGFAVVTLDADFHEYSLLFGGPPLVIWLKCGNQPKSEILKRLLDSREVIERAALNSDIWCLEIY